MPEGLGNKKGEGEGGRKRKAKVLKSPKSTGERWECGAGLGSLAGPPWAASPEQAALAPEVEPVWFRRGPDPPLSLPAQSGAGGGRGHWGHWGHRAPPEMSQLSPHSPGENGKFLPAPSSAVDPLSSSRWRVEEGESRAGAGMGTRTAPCPRRALSPAGTRGFPPPQAEAAPPPAPLKRLRFPSSHSGSPSPSFSQTRGTSASAEGSGDGPRIFNF